MDRIKQAILAGVLAGLLLLTGCGVFSAKETPVPEEFQQTAVVVFE